VADRLIQYLTDASELLNGSLNQSPGWPKGSIICDNTAFHIKIELGEKSVMKTVSYYEFESAAMNVLKMMVGTALGEMKIKQRMK